MDKSLKMLVKGSDPVAGKFKVVFYQTLELD